MGERASFSTLGMGAEIRTVLEAGQLEVVRCFSEEAVSELEGKAYYLMSIHEHLPPQARHELKEVGWTKGLELARIARRTASISIVQPGCTKRAQCRGGLQAAVEKGLTGKEKEPSELIYFKVMRVKSRPAVSGKR
jgi:hypothetical protein